MFGSAHGPTNPSKDSDTVLSHSPPKPSAAQGAISERTPRNSRDEETERTGEGPTSSALPAGRKSTDETNPGGEKKRRSSGIAKAGALFSTARNSLHLPGSSASITPADDPAASQTTAIQKLGKTDPALSVPQGSLNNSAGESRPGPRSTFRVGVTEDRNRKCRRTMEDTHAYLYNFLSTPAPSLGSDTESISSKKSQASKDASEPTYSVIQSSHMVETDNGYFAVFDGHAGTFAADWCGKKLHILLEEMIRKYPNTPIPELLDQTFTSVDQQLEKLPVKNSGCTAITAVLRWEDRIPSNSSATGSTAIAPAAAAAAKAALEMAGGAKASDPSASTPHSNVTFPGANAASVIPKLQDVASRQRVLYTANVGDARIVLCRNGKALRLSYDHKGSDENEGKRISSAGGLILNNRVNGVLAVTRALGDAYMKDLVTGHPYTTETVIQPDIDEFLILACDGLWDVCSDQEAVDLVRHTHDPQAASKQLVDHALARFSTDNLSCMIVRFDNKALQQTIERRNEPIGVDGDPPSLKKGGISEAYAILREAKKNMDEAGQNAGAEDKTKFNRETIQEEEEKEAKPQADRNGITG